MAVQPCKHEILALNCMLAFLASVSLELLWICKYKVEEVTVCRMKDITRDFCVAQVVNQAKKSSFH